MKKWFWVNQHNLLNHSWIKVTSEQSRNKVPSLEYVSYEALGDWFKECTSSRMQIKIVYIYSEIIQNSIIDQRRHRPINMYIGKKV